MKDKTAKILKKVCLCGLAVGGALCLGAMLGCDKLFSNNVARIVGMTGFMAVSSSALLSQVLLYEKTEKERVKVEEENAKMIREAAKARNEGIEK